MVACHLAQSRSLDFLFSDRTFSSLSAVCHWAFNSTLTVFFNLINSWNYDSSAAFISFGGYKVLACDHRDEIIPYMASLKVDVAQKVFTNFTGGEFYE
jgi:hypothetical protein